MNSNPIKLPADINPGMMFAYTVKNLKASLPKECTHLAPYKDSNGQHFVRAIVNKTEYLFTVPEGLIFKNADVTELREQITKLCKGDVSEGD